MQTHSQNTATCQIRKMDKLATKSAQPAPIDFAIYCQVVRFSAKRKA
jgi:hypothetical protein